MGPLWSECKMKVPNNESQLRNWLCEFSDARIWVTEIESAAAMPEASSGFRTDFDLSDREALPGGDCASGDYLGYYSVDGAEAGALQCVDSGGHRLEFTIDSSQLVVEVAPPPNGPSVLTPEALHAWFLEHLARVLPGHVLYSQPPPFAELAAKAKRVDYRTLVKEVDSLEGEVIYLEGGRILDIESAGWGHDLILDFNVFNLVQAHYFPRETLIEGDTVAVVARVEGTTDLYGDEVPEITIRALKER